ncbi:MAG: TlpA disulfide reductase family protein [Gammaproteobacteria bacterium]|jgi:thiol-disulfide isomerase/thioredoxin
MPVQILALGWLIGILSGQLAAAQSVALPEGIRPYDAPAPTLELSDMDGRLFSLQEDGRGQWVFVHFWASWCGPCRREMPAIQRMAAELEEQGLRVVLVNTAESEDTVFTFLAETAPALQSLMDRDGQVTEAWQPRGLPATYLVDPRGRIRYQALGGRPWDEDRYLEFLQGLGCVMRNSRSALSGTVSRRCAPPPGSAPGRRDPL